MVKVSSVTEFKEQGGIGKASVLFALVVPLIGLACIVAPHAVEHALPYTLGAVMVAAAVLGLVAHLRDKEHLVSRTSGTYLVGGILGAITFAQGVEAIGYLGVFWGVLALGKAAREIDGAIAAEQSDERALVRLAFAGVNIVLAILLIVSPFESFEHHLILLGVELVLYPFELHRTRAGKFVLEAEA